MIRNALTLGSMLCIAVLSACQARTEEPVAGPQQQPAPAAPAATPAPAASASAGRFATYTPEQAQRGQQVFQQVCSNCHSTTEWTEANFQRTWSGRSVHDLFSQIHDTMPMDAPGSLTRQQYADVIAYMLKLNGVQAGTSEIGTDDASLRAALIQWGSAR